MILHTLVHLGDDPTIPIRVRLGILLTRGVILLPSRGVGSRTIHLPMRARLLQIANNGTISRMTRNIFVMLLWRFCWTTSCEGFQPSPTLGLAFFQVDQSSQRSSTLAWFGHLRSAYDSAHTLFESRILEGRSLSTLLPSVSRTEMVSDSSYQGKALKVHSQVYDLLSSKPSCQDLFRCQ